MILGTARSASADGQVPVSVPKDTVVWAETLGATLAEGDEVAIAEARTGTWVVVAGGGAESYWGIVDTGGIS